MGHPEFDQRDLQILVKRKRARRLTKGARVGDFVNMPDDTLRRFTHDWGDTIQTTTPKFGFGSFYLGNGYASYSGALDPGIPKDKLEDTGETHEGAFWFFHHDHSCAHNGVYFKIPCRVFQYHPEQKERD